jgi:hypothetical protein
VDRLTPTDLNTDVYRQKALSGAYDLVILDRCAPATVADMPQADTFCIGQPPPPWQRGEKAVKSPLLIVSQPGHPLLRQLTTLWDVGISEAFAFDPVENLPAAVRADYALSPDDRDKALLPTPNVLIEGPKKMPLLFTLPRGPYTDLVQTFPLLNEKGELTTNWPLQPSFPLFLRHVLYLLGGVNDAVRPATVQPGEPLLLRPEASVKTLTIRTPEGRTETLQRGTRPDFIFADTERVGVYRVEPDDNTTQSFAVNLLDATESNIEPRTAIEIGNERIRAGQERPQPREIWKWIVLAALVLLLAEWYIYNRRVYI